MTVASLPSIASLDGVIFDCDGVLVDSERITNGVWASLLTEAGLPTSTEQSLATYMGNTMATCLDIVRSRLGHAPPDDLLPRFFAQAAEALAREVVAVPGIVDLLDLLDAAQVPYAVASNGEQAKMEVTLTATGLAPRFVGRRFSSGEVGRPKPAPDVFLHTAAQLGLRPAHTVVIEDSPLGVQGAAAAGMIVIGYAELVSSDRLQAAGAHACVTELHQLVPWLTQLIRQP
jgi:HAD superfamily hydrolase (TIGR01509 family)